MASATSSISLDDDFLPPQDLQPHAPLSTDTDIIAPWLVVGLPAETEQDLPVPSNRHKNFKSSLPSLRPRPSNASSIRTGTDNQSLNSTLAESTTHLNEYPRSDRDLKKKKSSASFLSNIVRRTRSKSRLGPAKLDLSRTNDYPVPPVPPSPDYIPYVPPPASPPAHSSTSRLAVPLLGKGKKTADVPPPVPSKDIEYPLNRDINDMEGIVDFDKYYMLQRGGIYENAPSSPSSGLESSAYSSAFTSDGSSSHHYHHASTSSLPSAPHGIFSNPNPFQPPAGGVKRKIGLHSWEHRNISPKNPAQFPASASVPTIRGHEDSLWKAPESWAVEPKTGIDEEVAEGTSSEGEDVSRPRSPVGRRNRRKRYTLSVSGRPRRSNDDHDDPYPVRIYRRDNTYHVATISLKSTVTELVPYLNNKMLLDTNREMHRLYLKERGRERLLAMTEKPANIVRRRLEQAGWDPVDDFRALAGEDIQYLMKFVYKSNVLGPADDDLIFNDFEHVDLAARALKTVPVILYSHAENIVSLNLSRNPMLEIPLDFIQLCASLRVLRLQNMSMKKVPQSVRHCENLHRLDLSCNRIVDLKDAGLDYISGLRSLKLQNNGMEKLPWYFPRLKSLRELNISNNKFKELPDVVCRLTNLIDLDISFNLIADLPEEIGNLEHLEKLITVGNQISRFPRGAQGLRKLRFLDCRRNMISDLATVCLLPKVETIMADHNTVHALDLSFGPSLQSLDASHNDITQLTLLPGLLEAQPFAMVMLDISHAKLSSLDGLALAQLTSLRTLKVDHNSIRALPDSIGELAQLRHLSCANNQLFTFPETIARLQNLETLEAHNNSLDKLPPTIWECSKLELINLTSNLLGDINNPIIFDVTASSSASISLSPGTPLLNGYGERKPSSASSLGRGAPPLVASLKRLYLGENRLTEDHLHPLTLLRELRVLNLSFNHIQVIPNAFLTNLQHLEELYLSGNMLTALPTEDLPSLSNLRVLYLNGNKLQSLPQELGKIRELQVLDVGSNVLKYNINNWEFDWNWNFNTNLRYLNLSGNKRLEIRPDHKAAPFKDGSDRKLADFSELKELKILGLMDVTTTFAPNIPDDNEDRRVRTSLSEVSNMAYGIADTLGQNLSMFDLVQPEFRGRENEAIFAMFGRASHIGSNNRLSKWLHDNYPAALLREIERLDEREETVADAMRRSFLKLNKGLHDWLFARDTRRPSTVSADNATSTPSVDYSSLRSGASGIVLYFVNRTLYVANAGNALAVISRQGTAELLSHKHDPFDRQETARIRAAEGWVSPKGFVNDEIDVSRSFGFYYLFPIVNARPDVITWELSELDEFVIIGNRGLWDFVSHQTAVDIARSSRDNPMIAAQKLRDFAISYGAEGTTMIMVISVSDLFGLGPSRSRQHTFDSCISLDIEVPRPLRRQNKDEITDRDVSRLDDAIPPIPPPQGHVALVFTDIRNSTHLWEANGGMQTAISYHNTLLRRQLRFCGGYEVKTEGDAFMCSFPTAMAALWWCLNVQIQLTQLPWPLEILECEDGKEIRDKEGKLVARGLSVRMGIHCGNPIPDPDPTTHRMDYLGPVVNRASRISGIAQGGQIAVSADVIREINASVFESESRTEHSHLQPPKAVEAIIRLGLKIIPVGEVKLKGLEAPESISLVYPHELAGRHDLESLRTDSLSGSRVQFSVQQMKELALLCVRLEALTTSRVFRPLPVRKSSTVKTADEVRQDPNPVFVYGNPEVLLPAIDKASDAELMLLLDSLSCRIENALASLTLRQIIALNKSDGGDVSARRSGAAFDVRTLQQLLSFLLPLSP